MKYARLLDCQVAILPAARVTHTVIIDCIARTPTTQRIVVASSLMLKVNISRIEKTMRLPKLIAQNSVKSASEKSSALCSVVPQDCGFGKKIACAAAVLACSAACITGVGVPACAACFASIGAGPCIDCA